MKKAFLLAAILFIFCGPAKAQNDKSEKSREIEEAVKKIPLEGSKPEDFVPAGWKFYADAAKADLNGDGILDYSFDIMPEDSDYDGVVVLFGEKRGKLRRVGFNDRLTSSGFGPGQSVSIEKGVLIVSSNYGNNYATDVTYRFRYDKAAAQLMLIGFDFEVYTRAGNDNGHLTSYNFLTGIKEDTTNFVDRRKNSTSVYNRSSTKKTRIERVKVPFEEARFNWAKGSKAPLPY